MDPLVASGTLESSCAVFNKDFTHPRPPENLLPETCDDTLNFTHFLEDDPTQSSLLVQMFLSELQGNGSSKSCLLAESTTEGEPSTALLAQEEVEPESNLICPASDVLFSEPVLCKKSCLNCPSNLHSTTTTDTVLNPLDDPFFSNFTDISTLEGALLHSSTDPSLSNNCCPNSPAMPKTPESVASCSVNVQTVLESNVCESAGVFDLSECVSFLTDSSISTTPHMSSPSASSCPSPISAPSVADSSPGDTVQLSSLIDNFDFSSLSGQDLQNVITSLVNLDDPYSQSSSPAPSPSSVASSNAIEDDLSNTSRKSRKRKLSEAIPASPPERLRRLSSDSSSSCSTVTETDEVPLSPEEKKKVRREKNNAASVVSRAKRRQRVKEMLSREKELEAANAELREKVDWLTTETAQLRNMLLHKLSKP